MKLLEELRNHVLEKEFKMIYENNKLIIVNYIDIPVFESKIIKVRYENGLIAIIGNDLVISKLIKDELLITGYIDKIEFINE